MECISLVDLTIPDSVTHIGHFAFAGCHALANLTIPDSVTHIGGGAFHSCSYFSELDHPGLKAAPRGTAA